MKTVAASLRSQVRQNFARAGMTLVLVALMMPLAASTSYAWRVPKTLYSVVGAGGSAGGRTLHPALLQRALPFPATELAVIWRGSDRPPRLRTSSDGAAWGAWEQPVESEDMYDPSTQTRYSNLLAGAGARFVQIAPSPDVNSGSVALAAINTRDGPLRVVRLTRSAVAATAQPAVVSRRAWGADESLRRGQPAFMPISKIFVHHTVTPNGADPAATLRAIYAYHVAVRGWEDVGYNFFIDPNGTVYEGRYSRAYGSGESPAGEDRQGRGVVGAHTEGHNLGSVGVALLGNADTRAPTAAAVDSLARVIAWKADRHNIDVMGNDLYRDESGRSHSLPNVAGHRDAPGSSTECPGSRLHPILPSVRERAKQIVDASRGRGPAGPVGETVRPILNAPAPGLGDSVAEVLKGLGL